MQSDSVIQGSQYYDKFAAFNIQ